MQTNDTQANMELLKKLRKKAEISRFCHSELKERYTRHRNIKEFSIVLLSLVSVAVINFYYRKVFVGEWVLSFIFILPLVTALLQALDSSVFKWTEKLGQHTSAIAIWGDWIRDANFLEKTIHQHESDVAEEKMRNIEEKYRVCMGSTEQIPNSKFLHYKKKFRAYLLKSQEIDEMSLEDIEREHK